MNTQEQLKEFTLAAIEFLTLEQKAKTARTEYKHAMRNYMRNIPQVDSFREITETASFQAATGLLYRIYRNRKYEAYKAKKRMLTRFNRLPDDVKSVHLLAKLAEVAA